MSRFCRTLFTLISKLALRCTNEKNKLRCSKLMLVLLPDRYESRYVNNTYNMECCPLSKYFCQYTRVCNIGIFSCIYLDKVNSCHHAHVHLAPPQKRWCIKAIVMAILVKKVTLTCSVPLNQSVCGVLNLT